MKNNEIKELSGIEIDKRIKEEEALLQKMKINHAVSELENPKKIAQTKKFLARLKTEKRKREISLT